MGTTVVTRTECDRCGTRTEHEGADGFTPPPGWASIRVSERHEGSGWTNSTTHAEGHYCPDCWRAVVRLLDHVDQ